MDKREERQIPAILLVGLVALYAMCGVVQLIGADWTMLLGLVVFGLMVFFLICVPLIECFVIFGVMKLLERQNKKLSRGKP